MSLGSEFAMYVECPVLRWVDLATRRMRPREKKLWQTCSCASLFPNWSDLRAGIAYLCTGRACVSAGTISVPDSA
eukprot:428658-Rhodomonas_salina.5